jgi:hypothetical protein
MTEIHLDLADFSGTDDVAGGRVESVKPHQVRLVPEILLRESAGPPPG